MTEIIIQHLSKDPKLAAVIPHINLSPVDVNNNIYHDLLDSIVSQQLSVKAAATIFSRFLDLFPDRKPHPEYVVATQADIMRGVGLSYQKAGYIKNIATYWIENQENSKNWMAMSDDDIIRELTQIKGVGKWTVQMILMFRLNRLDVFPIDDLGIRQGMVKMYELEETGKDLIKKLHEVAENWRPYRTIACRYVWKYKDAK